jgi:ABC-2 type transport system ATP-binding protein
VSTTIAPPTDGVSFAGVNKTFLTPAGPVHAVRALDLRIARGETVALLGPNGAGKSTTIEMLLGLAQPDAGVVQVMGTTPADAIRAGGIGAMLQTGAELSHLTVRELIDMMGSLYPQPLSVDETLAIAGITDLANRKTTKLSGGQSQRVRFAVAMVSDPELIVLDEPTVGMDVESRHQFWETMRGYAARGKTVIFATHYLDEADANADRIVLMARGSIVADGSPRELKAMTGGRIIRATLVGARPEILRALAGVTDIDIGGDIIELTCANSDHAIRALLDACPEVHDIEITGAGLEAVFLELTADDVQRANRAPR